MWYEWPTLRFILQSPCVRYPTYVKRDPSIRYSLHVPNCDANADRITGYDSRLVQFCIVDKLQYRGEAVTRCA